MSRLESFAPPVNLTRGEIARKEAADKAIADARPGFFQGAADAANSEWSVSWLYRALKNAPHETDPDFNPFSDRYAKTVTDGIDADLLGGFDGAHSFDHAMKIRDSLLSVQDSRRNLARMGWEGTALRVGAGLLDPGMIALAAATGGLGAEPMLAAKGSRIARFVKAGLVNTAVGVPYDAFMSSQDPQRGPEDIIYGAMGSFVLGGGFGRLGDWNADRVARRVMREMEYQQVRGLMGPGSAHAYEFYGSPQLNEDFNRLVMTDKGRKAFHEQVDPAERLKLRDSMIDRLGLDETHDADELAHLRAIPPDEFIARVTTDRRGKPVGLAADEPIPDAARNPNLRPPTEDEIAARAAQLREEFPEMDPKAARDTAIFQISQEDATKRGIKPDTTPKTADVTEPPEPPVPKKAGDASLDHLSDDKGRGGRFSVGGLVGRSDSPLMRMAGRAYAEDALPTKGHAPVSESMEEWGVVTHKNTLARAFEKTEAAKRKYFDAEGVPWYLRMAGGKAERDFYEKVGRAITKPPGSFTDANLNAAVESIRDGIEKVYGIGYRHGVPAFEKFDAIRTYRPRLWNIPRLIATANKIGHDALGDFIGRAFAATNADVLPEKASKIGRGILKVLLDTDKWSEFQKMHMFDPKHTEILTNILRENVPNITDKEVADFLSSLPKAQDKNHPRAMRRVDLDENHFEHDVPMTDGGYLPLGIADLVENDARQLLSVYSRQVTGQAAYQTILKKFSDITGKDLKTFDSLLAVIKDDMRAHGVDPETGAGLRDISRLTLAHKALVGQRIVGTGVLGEVANPEIAHWLRRTRGVANLLINGAYGVAQLPEFAEVIFSGGGRAMMQQMPAMKQMFKKAADGTLENEAVRDLVAITAAGDDKMSRQILTRMDDEIASGTAGGNRADRMLSQVGRASSDINLVQPITAVQQRMAVLMGAQKMVNQALDGKPPSMRRLALIGMTPERWERLATAIRADKTSIENGVLKRIDLDSWADQDAAHDFITGLNKWSKRAVQENSVGTMAAWMSTDMGKTIVQSRAFGIVAYEKQMLAKLYAHDPQAVMTTLMSMMVAALAYTGQQYINSAGRADAKEYRAKMLTTDRILKQGFSRGGFSSLIPGAVDSWQAMTGGEQVFGYGRNSGLAGNWFTGNPTVAMGQSAIRALSGAAGAVRGQVQGTDGGKKRLTIDQSDAQSFSRLIPFRNLIGVKNLIDAVVTRFPKD